VIDGGDDSSATAHSLAQSNFATIPAGASIVRILIQPIMAPHRPVFASLGPCDASITIAPLFDPALRILSVASITPR
jgi:hypothetical protein